MTKTISKWKVILPIGIIAAVLAIGIAAAVYYLSPANYLSLDVNPSIEIQTNRLNQVVSVNAVNEDAKQILAGYELMDRNLETVIRNIVDRMVLNGYIASDKDNEILISTDENNTAVTLADTVNSIITTYLNEKQLAGNTILQTVNATAEELQASHDNNVSVGKMRLIKSLMANDSSLTMEELSGLRISELLAISANKNSTMTAAASDNQGDANDLEEADKEAVDQNNENANESDVQGTNEDADKSDDQSINEEAAGRGDRHKEDAEEDDSDYKEAHASKNQSKYEDANDDSDEGNNEDADEEDGQNDIEKEDNHINKHSIKKDDQEDNHDSEDAYVSDNREDNEDSEDAYKVESGDDSEDSDEDRTTSWSSNEDRHQSGDEADYSHNSNNDEED